MGLATSVQRITRVTEPLTGLCAPACTKPYTTEAALVQALHIDDRSPGVNDVSQAHKPGSTDVVRAEMTLQQQSAAACRLQPWASLAAAHSTAHGVCQPDTCEEGVCRNSAAHSNTQGASPQSPPAEVTGPRACRYHEQPGYESFAALLSKPKEDAAVVVESRFPVPRVVDADNFTVQGRSQSRFLLVRLNPSSTHSSAATASEVIFTDDVSLEVFLQHLKTLAVQS